MSTSYEDMVLDDDLSQDISSIGNVETRDLVRKLLVEKAKETKIQGKCKLFLR